MSAASPLVTIQMPADEEVGLLDRSSLASSGHLFLKRAIQRPAQLYAPDLIQRMVGGMRDFLGQECVDVAECTQLAQRVWCLWVLLNPGPDPAAAVGSSRKGHTCQACKVTKPHCAFRFLYRHRTDRWCDPRVTPGKNALPRVV